MGAANPCCGGTAAPTGLPRVNEARPLAARCEAFSRCTDNLHRSDMIGSVASSDGSDARKFV